MNIRVRTVASLILSMVGLVILPGIRAQSDSNATYAAQRKEAFSLFNQNKFLDALPLFETLAAENPKDHQVLLGLAACLVDHSATISDAEAQGKERERARQLLVKAHDLGDNSPLLLNLLQILQSEPQKGKIKYSENPAANDAMQAGEAAFARGDYDAAIASYSHALDLDQKNSGAALFVGDSYFAKKDFAHAGEWYGRASQIDPNLETPYRYYADMLFKSGDMEGARTKAIQAVVAEPYNPITWRSLDAWAKENHLELIRVHVNTPKAPDVAQAGSQSNVTIALQPDGSSDIGVSWLAYTVERALWHGDKFKQQYPDEAEYRHSLAEEADSLTSTAKVWSELTAKRQSSQPDTDIALLTKIYAADMIEPHVLLNAADEGIAKDYGNYREKNRAKLAQYLSEFVVPPAPHK